FDIEDGATLSLECLTVQGVGGFFGRQNVILDLYDVNCGALTGGCVAVTVNSIATINRDLWISGDAAYIAFANERSSISFGGNVVVRQKVNVTSFILSYRLSFVGFTGGNAIANPEHLAGSRCRPYYGGRIQKSGVALPCEVDQTGSPQQGNDGAVYD